MSSLHGDAEKIGKNFTTAVGKAFGSRALPFSIWGVAAKSGPIRR